MSTLYPLAVQKTFAKKSVQLINNLISRYCASKKCETHHLFGQLQKHTFFTYPRQFLRSRAPWVGHVCASLLNCEWDQLQSKGMVHGMEWQHSTSPLQWEDESRMWAMTMPQVCIYSWLGYTRRDGLDLNRISEDSEYNRRHNVTQVAPWEWLPSQSHPSTHESYKWTQKAHVASLDATIKSTLIEGARIH